MTGSYVQLTLAGTEEQEKTAVYLWRPKGEVRGVVQIIHGMREHMGRYDDFAVFLNIQGFAVVGHDHMGHGRSGGSDAAFGYFGKRNGPRTLLRQCRRVTQLARREYPGVPLFLLGHSMGSFIARLYLLSGPADYAGFICMGTGGEHRLAPLGRVLAGAAVHVLGDQAEGRILDRLTFSGYNRRVSGDASRMAWLSRDIEEVERFEWDALIRPCFTNAGLRDLFELQMAASGKQWAGRVDKALPILLVSGSEDPVGDYGRGVVQVYERLKLAGVRDVHCKLYEGARHELLHEQNKEEVYFDLFRWMEAHLPH